MISPLLSTIKYIPTTIQYIQCVSLNHKQYTYLHNKSVRSTHGYGLGTLCVPNNKQGNYLSNLLGSNLCELKRLRRSSLTFFSRRLSS